MTLTVGTDHAWLRGVVEPMIAADPVRNTVLGTITLTLEESAWAATDGAGRVAMRSSVQYPVVLAGSWPTDLLDELRVVLSAVPDLTGLAGPETEVLALADVLGTDVRAERQRLFRLDDLIEPPTLAGHAEVAGPAHRDFGRACVAGFGLETHDLRIDTEGIADRALDAGQMHLWVDATGVPVSMACRRPLIGGSARISPVYTPADQRGHGYASGATASATRSILDDGGIPVLFTDLANPTSNKIYQALGYHPVEDRLVLARR